MHDQYTHIELKCSMTATHLYDIVQAITLIQQHLHRIFASLSRLLAIIYDSLDYLI